MSLQQLAKELGVSPATVSNALRGKGRMSDALRNRVREMADRMGYLPSHAGRSLRMGRSANLGLVVPDFAMPLFPTFARAFESAARKRGQALMVADAMGSAEAQLDAIRDIVGRGVDALIVIPLRSTELYALSLPVPIVQVDSAANPANVVASDHRAGGRKMADHIVALGHKQVIVLISSGSSSVSEERAAGFRESFEAAGVEMRTVSVPPDFDRAREVGLGLDLGSATACVAAYDTQAVGFLAAFRERGLDVPGDVSVTGFDDVIWGRIVSPGLMTVRQDLDAIAEHALDVAAGVTNEPRLFPVELVTRGSTAAPRGQDQKTSTSKE